MADIIHNFVAPKFLKKFSKVNIPKAILGLKGGMWL
jgi:hypothetical protein